MRKQEEGPWRGGMLADESKLLDLVHGFSHGLHLFSLSGNVSD